MKKPSPRKKTVAPKAATTTRKPAAAKAPLAAVSAAALAKAKALEKLDAQVPAKAKPKAGAKAAPATATTDKPLRNADFPTTYISEVHVSLNDPNHAMTLIWTGPQAGAQETGPFHTSPGAGVKGINCDNAATSVRSGTKCTPKGTRTVEGFQSALNSEPRAVFVTWFMRARGIALHYFPSVPTYAASHGCVRIELKRVARLVQENSRIGVTKVTVDGTWTKPAKQW